MGARRTVRWPVGSRIPRCATLQTACRLRTTSTHGALKIVLQKAECNILAVAGDNSQVCEQLFAKIGRHKHVVRHMEKLTSRCLLTELGDVKNEECLATNNRRDALRATAIRVLMFLSRWF